MTKRAILGSEQIYEEGKSIKLKKAEALQKGTKRRTRRASNASRLGPASSAYGRQSSSQLRIR
jgi:hypothetical protein